MNQGTRSELLEPGVQVGYREAGGRYVVTIMTDVEVLRGNGMLYRKVQARVDAVDRHSRFGELRVGDVVTLEVRVGYEAYAGWSLRPLDNRITTD